MSGETRVFGVRHHGPGSARSLLRALGAFEPDSILLEGPPDAQELLALAAHPEMKPPVALLVYAHDDPRSASFFPFAEFSPEWQATRYGLSKGVALRFMDLPQAHRIALEKRADEAAEGEPEGDADLSADPLTHLARAAGWRDGERWWDHVIESRSQAGDAFAAVHDAMATLRESASPRNAVEPLREAWMRKTLRSAQKEGFQRIAVVCGAWHAPALSRLPPAKEDAALLSGLPKVKTRAAWVPWSYGRLGLASGYGAGVVSPAWYDLLWQGTEAVAERWLTAVARLLREQDLDASSAHVIEAVRLAEALAALRGRALPGLDELLEAARTVLCFGGDAALGLISERLVVGERLGRVPAECPAPPLARDLERLQKTLRLKPSAQSKRLELDLRRAIDRERSQLFHRLQLIDVPWAEPQGSRGKGTFRETWRLRWEPELAVRLVEAGRLGNDVHDAATTAATLAARRSDDLASLTALLDRALLADLPFAVHRITTLLESRAALATDMAQLMGALPPLANVMRYGNVRQTDGALVAHLIATLVPRIVAGLPGAASALDGEASEALLGRIDGVHGAIALLADRDHAEAWAGALRVLADRQDVHALITGRVVRLLLDARRLDRDEVARRFGLALSHAADATVAASFVDGLLRGSGLLLVHDPTLFGVIDDWLRALAPERFDEALPLLRRTFATFEAPERRQLGERVGRPRAASHARPDSDDFDFECAARARATAALLLGLPEVRQ